jgi:hypothetical protein
VQGYTNFSYSSHLKILSTECVTLCKFHNVDTWMSSNTTQNSVPWVTWHLEFVHTGLINNIITRITICAKSMQYASIQTSYKFTTVLFSQTIIIRVTVYASQWCSYGFGDMALHHRVISIWYFLCGLVVSSEGPNFYFFTHILPLKIRSLCCLKIAYTNHPVPHTRRHIYLYSLT